jgi:phosphatase NudJ
MSGARASIKARELMYAARAMAREAIPTWFFVLVVVRRGDRFLVVRERKHGGGWYLPAGRAEPGESLAQAAYRETLEESGVEIELEGILRFEHTPQPTGTRVRVHLVARAKEGSTPRTTENEHTMGAAFHTIDELASMHLRGGEVIEIFRAVERGAAIAPMSLLTIEGAPFEPA